MAKTENFKTYLAGAFCPYTHKGDAYGEWRDFVKSKIKNQKIKLRDPRLHSNQLCPATFTIDDAAGVISSDILLHYRTRGHEDDGASWEHGIAFACNLLNQQGYFINNIDKKIKVMPVWKWLLKGK